MVAEPLPPQRRSHDCTVGRSDHYIRYFCWGSLSLSFRVNGHGVDSTSFKRWPTSHNLLSSPFFDCPCIPSSAMYGSKINNLQIFKMCSKNEQMSVIELHLETADRDLPINWSVLSSQSHQRKFSSH